jgi:hypothetical protein
VFPLAYRDGGRIASVSPALLPVLFRSRLRLAWNVQSSDANMESSVCNSRSERKPDWLDGSEQEFSYGTLFTSSEFLYAVIFVGFSRPRNLYVTTIIGTVGACGHGGHSCSRVLYTSRNFETFKKNIAFLQSEPVGKSLSTGTFESFRS